MNRSNQHLGVVFISAFVILLILAVAMITLSRMTTAVSAVGPPTAVPALTGDTFTAVIDTSLLNQTPVNITMAGAGWTVVLSETFESGIGAGWSVIDRDGITNGEYRWGVETFTPPSTGTLSAWAIGDGQQGGLLDISSDGYPANVDSWLIYGPIDMSNVVDASLTFDYWLDADTGDEFGVAVSTSGTDSANFTGIQTNSGGSGGWSMASHNLASYIGESVVFIGFKFSSDATGSTKTGALLDNVEILVENPQDVYLPVIRIDPTPTPSPTPTVPPSSDYRDDFTDDIDGWELRRADTQDRFEVYHGPSGILNVRVKDPDDYIIVSPLVAAPSIPYSLEIDAQHKEPEDHDILGIVFGADWDGSTCPNTDFSSCFESFYILKVEYRTNDGTYLRFKLQKVESHVNNHPNNPENLIDWTDVSTDENDFNKWRVEIEADNDIKIYLNDNRVGEVRDNGIDSFIEPYFGAFVQTKEQHGDFRGKFDYFEVKDN